MADCVFCKIINGMEAASVVAEDEHVLAIMDVAPVNEGHVLIMPKRHAEVLNDLTESESVAITKLAIRIQAAIRNSEIACEGINLFFADGESAGQEVFHAHLHVIPRIKNDGFHLTIDYPTAPNRKELDAKAEIIASKMI